jgi:hypothetical protein
MYRTCIYNHVCIIYICTQYILNIPDVYNNIYGVLLTSLLYEC